MAELEKKPIGQLVAEHPEYASILEQSGIDYCCHGHLDLATVCRQRGVSTEELLERLQAATPSAQDAEAAQLAHLTLEELAQHIVQRHHTYLRSQLPRLSDLLATCLQRHSEEPSLQRLAQVFRSLAQELQMHLLKEENILFPSIAEMERQQRHLAFPFGSLRNPIAVMIHEHDDSAANLARIREITHQYTPPEDACSAWRSLYEGLKELDTDLRQHIHKENNLLFPRALALEQSLSAGEAS
ncbi:MAG: iron-sulfur cluster repair di-iron protein [Gemmataceae bacterium]